MPIEEDGRVIACHFESSGFPEGCKLVLRPRKKSSDPYYHTDMHASDFKKWFLQFLNELNIERAVIVIDNASYRYSVVVGRKEYSI